MESNKFFSILFLLLISSSAQSASVFVEGGLHAGGDTIATLVFTDGSSESIKGGGLLSGSIGVIADINEDLELRSAFGVKIDVITAENGDADFIRYPLEFMLFTKAETVSFGLGISYHLDPTFSASGPFIGGEIPFDDALGFVAEADYMLGAENKAYLGFKATFIDYVTTDVGFGTATVSGNSLGVVIGVRF